jgi:2-hydroxychromene-2-carboxylate isomerase
MKPIEFLFDYASPWAYLASELLERRLPGASIDWRPIYLRGLETFAKGLPYGSRKLAYIGRDFQRCAEHEGVATRFPDVFPINALYALRGALVALEAGRFAAYHRAMFQAAWRDNRDVSRKEVVVAVAAEAGEDAARFAAALDAPAIKEWLRDATARAEARGVFGVPSFFIGDELFWGHDRMEYVQRAALR